MPPERSGARINVNDDVAARPARSYLCATKCLERRRRPPVLGHIRWKQVCPLSVTRAAVDADVVETVPVWQAQQGDRRWRYLRVGRISETMVSRFASQS